MKGLLIKDLKLMKNQKFFLLIACASGVLLLLNSAKPPYMISYMTFICSMFAMTSVSYDEYDNGLAFLFSLPVSRKKYVMEKYLFGLLLGGTAWLVTTAASTVYLLMKHPETDWLEWIAAAVVCMLLFLLFLFIMMPIQLKFGGEKGRIAMLCAVGIVFVIAFVFTKAADYTGIDVEAVLIWLTTASKAELLAAAFIVCSVAAVTSCTVSLNVMRKKEL